MLERMARRYVNTHYGTMHLGPQFPPYYSSDITWIRGKQAKSVFSNSLCSCSVRGQHNPGLVCLKSRSAKKNLSIPRLELVAAHMMSNVVSNIERLIDTAKVSSVPCWSDSTVALYWLNGHGEYQQFVSNRVAKIKERDHIQWHHVPTDNNPADR